MEPQITECYEMGTAGAKKILDKHPETDAFVCATDTIAADALSELHAHGKSTFGRLCPHIILAIVASGMLMGIMSAISYMGGANMITLDTSSVWWRIAGLINACALGNLQILLGFSAATVLAVTHILVPRLVLSLSAQIFKTPTQWPPRELRPR